jgi:hypothetical protein
MALNLRIQRLGSLGLGSNRTIQKLCFSKSPFVTIPHKSVTMKGFNSLSLFHWCGSWALRHLSMIEKRIWKSGDVQTKPPYDTHWKKSRKPIKSGNFRIERPKSHLRAFCSHFHDILIAISVFKCNHIQNVIFDSGVSHQFFSDWYFKKISSQQL